PVPPEGSEANRQSYASTLVDQLRANDYRLEEGRVTLVMARMFGFCWGVDKAVEIVQDALAAFPNRQIWLVNQMIHNPAVNQDLISRGIKFIKGTYSDGQGFAAVSKDDVAIIPAFSSAVEEILELEKIGCEVIDTTCPWVLKPHLRTKRNIEAGFTTLIHATLGHDETRATCSLITHEKGKYLVVRDLDETQLVIDFIRGANTAEDLMKALGNAASPDFDPEKDLTQVALINQTTMLASESREIGKRVQDVMIERYGEDAIKEHFRDFDTICNATQDNQDAMLNLVDKENLDLMIVVGGFESSNTKNLARIAWKKVPTYHIEDSNDLSPDQVRHLPVDSYESVTSQDWLRSEGPLCVGFTAGASTPDTKLAEVIAKVTELAGESLSPTK
ncbi:MAG: 4-hydroxy-3-methylbut-2-enyl diphosphate reductase, partial [Candidatus Eisenbacteria bacterium]|nr:4-hydroxy-3-methylbut-2-enyl diphosphate reductase [Candidatus Eisenbacteria bacterium]